MTGLKFPLCSILTRGDGVGEYIHAMEDMAHREGFQTKVWATDTYPQLDEVFEAIYEGEA